MGDGAGVEAAVAIQEVVAVGVAVAEEVEVIDQVEETHAVVVAVEEVTLTFHPNTSVYS